MPNYKQQLVAMGFTTDHMMNVKHFALETKSTKMLSV